MKKKPDSLKFIIYAVTWSLLIMAFLHVIEPVLSPDEREGDMRVLQQDMVTLSADDLQVRLTSSTKPSLVFFYASWCGYCRSLMPKLVDAYVNHQMDHLQVLMVSVEGDKRKLSKYLVHAGYTGKFMAYITPEWRSNELPSLMRSLGGSYDGTIPYSAVFDPGGTLRYEQTGAMNGSELRQFLAASK